MKLWRWWFQISALRCHKVTKVQRFLTKISWKFLNKTDKTHAKPNHDVTFGRKNVVHVWKTSKKKSQFKCVKNRFVSTKLSIVLAIKKLKIVLTQKSIECAPLFPHAVISLSLFLTTIMLYYKTVDFLCCCQNVF